MNGLLKIYINPFVSFIWLGVIIMVYSGFIGFTKDEINHIDTI